MLNFIKLSPFRGRAPQQAVIYLHGATRRASDVSRVVNVLQYALPNALFLAPTAPLPYGAQKPSFSEKHPAGYVWYPIDDFSPAVLYPRMREKAPALQAYLDDVMESFHLLPRQIALVGMSQGTMIGLYAALRRAEPLAGIVGFSGALPDIEDLPFAYRSCPPVLLVHGTKDEQVPFSRMEEARRALEAIGVPVETLALAGGRHMIDDHGLVRAALFLQRVFGLYRAAAISASSQHKTPAASSPVCNKRQERPRGRSKAPRAASGPKPPRIQALSPTTSQGE